MLTARLRQVVVFPSNGKIPSDFGMIQPRFGLAWDRKGNGTEVFATLLG